MGDNGSSVFIIDFGAGRTAQARQVDELGDLAAAVEQFELGRPRPVLVVVGGADGMPDSDQDRMRSALAGALIPAISATGAAVIDGGTDAGVMRMMGRARSGFPLIGVAVRGKVQLPGRAAPSEDAAPLEPHHSHFLLVDGVEWGDETSWLAGAATELAGGASSVTVLVNGGRIAYDDVQHSLRAGRPVLVLAGTGRTADRIAAARAGDRGEEQANNIADSPLVHIAPVSEPDQIRDQLAVLLEGRA